MISLETVDDYKKFYCIFSIYQLELMRIQNDSWTIQTPDELKAVKDNAPNFKDMYIKQDNEIVGYLYALKD